MIRGCSTVLTTLTVLKKLGPDGKRDVVRFLYENELIKAEHPLVSLAGADLTYANLSGLTLFEVNLRGAHLSNADLSDASFCLIRVHGSGWVKAIKRGGGLQDVMQPIHTSDLSQAKLSGAILERALLCGSNLLGADFANAILLDADVRGGTDLRLAKNLTQEQIEQAYGATGDQEYMPDTLLPEYLEAPEAWTKLFSQQLEERAT